jgi:hypothetical protein
MSGSARLLHELLLLHDPVLTLSETHFFSQVELEDIIVNVCTSSGGRMLLAFLSSLSTVLRVRSL